MALSSTWASAGFREGANSVHTSRTMMLADLRAVLNGVTADASVETYRAVVVDQNVLGKPTRATRERTAQRLSELYVLDPSNSAYTAFRRLWATDPRNQPMLAFLMACWRDPLLRQLTSFVLALPLGSNLTGPLVAGQLRQEYPQRFGDKTIRSVAQNLASSWTQAGYLTGKLKKVRSRPHVSPAVAAFALYLGHLRGGQGQLLLDSQWARLLDRSPNDVVDLAVEASKQGWMRYKSSGSVVEISFPDWRATTETCP